MRLGSNITGYLNAVPLHDAVYCANCEIITNSPHDSCTACGSPSVVNLFRMLGGDLASATAPRVAKAPKYNLRLTAEVSEIPADALNNAIQFVSRLADAAGTVKTLHISVEPVLQAAATSRAA